MPFCHFADAYFHRDLQSVQQHNELKIMYCLQHKQATERAGATWSKVLSVSLWCSCITNWQWYNNRSATVSRAPAPGSFVPFSSLLCDLTRVLLLSSPLWSVEPLLFLCPTSPRAIYSPLFILLLPLLLHVPLRFMWTKTFPSLFFSSSPLSSSSFPLQFLSHYICYVQPHLDMSLCLTFFHFRPLFS